MLTRNERDGIAFESTGWRSATRKKNNFSFLVCLICPICPISHRRIVYSDTAPRLAIRPHLLSLVIGELPEATHLSIYIILWFVKDFNQGVSTIFSPTVNRTAAVLDLLCGLWLSYTSTAQWAAVHVNVHPYPALLSNHSLPCKYSRCDCTTLWTPCHCSLPTIGPHGTHAFWL